MGKVHGAGALGFIVNVMVVQAGGVLAFADLHHGRLRLRLVIADGCSRREGSGGDSCKLLLLRLSSSEDVRVHKDVGRVVGWCECGR